MAYSPKRKMLECVYCGSTKELDLTPAAVKENSYEQWAKHRKYGGGEVPTMWRFHHIATR